MTGFQIAAIAGLAFFVVMLVIYFVSRKRGG